MYDAWLDLVLGSRCGVCGHPGRILCRLCASALPGSAHVAWPTPCPPGLVLPVAAGEYDGGLKILVNAHKERQQFSLVDPLGVMLARCVEGVLDYQHLAPATPCFLVPVPSRSPVVRARGHDPMLRVSRRAACLLRRRGHLVVVMRLLKSTAPVHDQAGLNARERAANLLATMTCSTSSAARLRTRFPEARFVVADDVLTTGATAREAQRALEACDLAVAGVATIAATRRLLPLPTDREDSRGSLSLSHRED